jgi:hypothetical protein
MTRRTPDTGRARSSVVVVGITGLFYRRQGPDGLTWVLPQVEGRNGAGTMDVGIVRT